MSRSKFDSFSSFIRRFHRAIIAAWIVALVLSAALMPTFFAGVSYNITSLGGSTSSQDSESQIAQNILHAQFPSQSTAGNNSVLVIIENPTTGVYSNATKTAVLQLDSAVRSDPLLGSNYTGMSSIYSTEEDVLNSTVPSFISGVTSLSAQVTALNRAVFSLEENLTVISSDLFQEQNGINQTAQLIFGIPAAFTTIWTGIVSAGQTNTTLADEEANTTLYARSGGFGDSPLSAEYYAAFLSLWSSSFQGAPNLSPLQREVDAISGAVGGITSGPSLDNATKGLVLATASGLNVTDWDQPGSVANLTVDAFASQVPSGLTSPLGLSPTGLVKAVYYLGQSPTSAALTNLAVSLIAKAPASGGVSASDPDSAVAALVEASSSLGPSPTQNSIWGLAASFFSNETTVTFEGSPLFSVNAASLGRLLSGLNASSSPGQMAGAIRSIISDEGVSDFPLVLSRSLTREFVGANNDTMIVALSFSSTLSSGAISALQQDVKSSPLSLLARTYVTGGAVISNDFENAFTPAYGVILAAGLVASIIIAGLLFAAPLAALIPLLLGGVSIVVGYAAIYLGVVVAGGGRITFLTPTLATLLMLGLAVDYSVLQLRRTKEERTGGKTKAESVATSVRWAGQAVLTAGITVVVAYLILSAANVPAFSDVGVAIAIGVTVLLLASLTLLPSLELALGDRLFWPRLKVGGQGSRPGRLARISDATLKRKLAVALLITLCAGGALAATASTPTGLDLLKLVPNFQSNQGLTAITNSMGSGTISPTQILITTPTPIVYGDDQFNQTLLNQIELISSQVAGSLGVVSVDGPTRPYGSPFNYSSVSVLAEPLRSQYLEGMLQFVGRDNTTALISVGLNSASESAQSVASLEAIESNVKSAVTAPGVAVYYGGDASQTLDSQQFISGLIPEVLIVLVVAVYAILFLQLRSAFTPLRLIFTILCSVVFSLTLLAVTFYYLLQLPIFDYVALFVIVTMLGVGIDYDIFYVTRIREEILGGKTNDEAIKTATTKVWTTICGLGIILSCVFGSLLLTGIALLQEIGLAMAGAVLIDVSVVILFFVPSLMALAERFNWWPSRTGASAEGVA